MYKISFQTNCYAWTPYGYTGLYPGSENNLDYAIKNLASLGYDGVEVDCIHILDTRLWQISKAQRRILKKSISELGIEIEAFSAHEWPLAGASFTSTDEDSRKLGLEWTKGIIDLAADFDTKIVTTHVPSPRAKVSIQLEGMPRGLLRGRGVAGRPLFESNMPNNSEERKLMIQAVTDCADYSQDRGVMFAIEEYAPLDFWKEYIKEVGSKALKINFHVGRVWSQMIRRNMCVKEPSLPDAVRELEGLIVHTHCMDYRTVSSLPPLAIATTRPTVEVVPGTGECDYIAFIKALKEICYEGYLTIECHRSDISAEVQAAQGLQNMRKLINQAL